MFLVQVLTLRVRLCLAALYFVVSPFEHIFPPEPLRLLSLDGGGYHGLALLYVLRHIMRNIPGINPSEKLYPHKYFDLIGGTSTGGLVAVMLGRLGMDIQAAIEKYQELGPSIFGQDRGAFLGVVVQGVKTHCYARSGGLILAQGSAGVPKAVYD